MRATCEGAGAQTSVSLEATGRVPSHTLTSRHEQPPPQQPTVIGRPSQKAQGNGAPIIDEIVVEKMAVCRGEDNLVTVRAHSPKDADNVWLGYTVGEKDGASIPLLYANDSRVPRMVLVHGKMNESVAIAEVPHVTVMDCLVPRRVLVPYALVPNTEDTFRFNAQVVPVGDKTPYEACAYEWDFGDDVDLSRTSPGRSTARPRPKSCCAPQVVGCRSSSTVVHSGPPP